MVPGNDEQSAGTSTGFLPATTTVFKTGGDLSARWKVRGSEPFRFPAKPLADRKVLAGLNERKEMGQFYAGLRR